MVLNHALAMQMAHHAAPAVAESVSDSIMDFAVIPYITLSIFCALIKMMHDHPKFPTPKWLIRLSYGVFIANYLLIFSMHVGFMLPADNVISAIFHVAIIIIASILACILAAIMKKAESEKSGENSEDLTEKLNSP